MRAARPRRTFNITLVHPDQWEKNLVRDAEGVEWKRAEAGVEWRAAKRKEIPSVELLRLFDEWVGARHVFDMCVATPVDPEGEQAPDDWYDLPAEMRANIAVQTPRPNTRGRPNTLGRPNTKRPTHHL